MSMLKRYFNALGPTPRKAVLRCVKWSFLTSAIILVVGLVVLALLNAGFGAFSLFLSFLFLLLSFGLPVFELYLAVQAFRAIKAWLFELDAPGYPNENTWTGGNGFLLGLSVWLGTMIPINLCALILSVFTGFSLSDIATLFYVIVGAVLTVISMKKFIPLDRNASLEA